MDFHVIVSQFHACEHINEIAQLWDPFFSRTVDDITFLITSNNYVADDVNTIVCMMHVHG